MLIKMHLIVEYNEITRPINKMSKRIRQYGDKHALSGTNIPLRYVLNDNHETFFFNKLKFLWKRRAELYHEMVRRGMRPDPKVFKSLQRKLKNEVGGSIHFNDYHPHPNEIYLNFARLCGRSKLPSVIDELCS